MLLEQKGLSGLREHQGAGAREWPFFCSKQIPHSEILLLLATQIMVVAAAVVVYLLTGYILSVNNRLNAQNSTHMLNNLLPVCAIFS